MMELFEGKRKQLKCILLAFLGTIGIVIELTEHVQNSDIGGAVLWIPIFLFLYYLYDRMVDEKIGSRMQVMILIYSICLSISLDVGAALDHGQKIYSIPLCLKSMAIMFCVYPMIKILTCWLDSPRKQKYTSASYDRKLIMIAFAIVLIFWVMGYLAMFPGIYGIDAPTWYAMWNPENRMIIPQWSVFISGLFHYTIRLGEKIGSANLGLAMFSMIQILCNLYAIWRILGFIQKRVGNKAAILTALFFSLIPTHVIIAVTSGQDAIFSACFAMCSIYIVRLSTEEDFWKSKKNIASLILWLILLCITRNNGSYVMLVMGVLSIFFVKRNRKQLYLAIGGVMVFVIIYQGPVYSLLNVQKGNSLRAMLSLPLQQMASVYNYGDLEEELKKEMEEYVPKEDLEGYMPGISDTVKNNLNTDKIKEDFPKFVKLYFKVCSESPKYAMKGLLKQTYGLWYLNKNYPDADLWHPYLNYKNTDARISWGEDALNITQNSLFPPYYRLLAYLFGDGDDESGYGGNLETNFQRIPILGTLCRLGIYFWIVVYIFAYGICKKWKEKNLIASFDLGLTCTIFLSPLMCYRYYAPVIFSIPITISMLFFQEK